MSEDYKVLVNSLRDRAVNARREDNATAISDAWHFEHSADAIDRIARELSEAKARAERADDALALAGQECEQYIKEIASQRNRAERAEALLKEVPCALSASFNAGMEEREGGSARRQAKALVPVEKLRREVRAALAQKDAAPPRRSETQRHESALTKKDAAP